MDLLRQFNGSLVALTSKISRAVVQVQVTSLGPLEEKSNSDQTSAVIAREHAIGSGVIIDSQGYIMTNAHVVERAQRVRVVLPVPDANSPFDITAQGKEQVLDAKLVGSDRNIDLALLKVEATNLPTLPLAVHRPVRAGELVLAVGSPEGLQTSVTMGVVSSVWRQPDPESPMAYIQTDAPINHGNSGGPLVDLDGYVVGINTFILSETGGNEGLGFAIPAAVVNAAYNDLKRYGHVHRTEIKAVAQTITPTLSAGLKLQRNWGVIISDVTPDGPADQAGVKVQDIVLTVDGRSITGLPGLTASLYLHPADEVLTMEVLRGANTLSLNIPALQYHDPIDQLEGLIDANNRIGRLGIFAADFDEKLHSLVGDARVPGGVVVVAQTLSPNTAIARLRAGDIIHALNSASIRSTDQLKAVVRELKTGDPVVLQVERDGKLQYLAFEME